VRQLTDESGSITVATNYGPYRKTINRIGDGTSRFGFTGEDSGDYIKNFKRNSPNYYNNFTK
jgi:hypothetical protein